MIFNKEREKMCALFSIREPFMDDFTSYITGRFRINIIKLDDWCVAQHNYSVEKDGSLHDFTEKTFGKDAVEFVKDNL